LIIQQVLLGILSPKFPSWDADITRDTTTAGADGFDALYGLGISYAFTRKFKGTADWEVIDSPNPEFSTFSLGFKWEFE
jgi:hypothetical protein